MRTDDERPRGFAAFLDLYATQPLLPLLARTFGASTFDVGLTVTAPTIAVALAAPVIGRLADGLGLRRVIVGSAFALTLATAMAATSTSLQQLIFWRFVQGLATPGIFGSAVAYIHEVWPPTHAGRAMAMYMTGTVLGGFTGRAVAGLVAADVSWPASFVALAIMNGAVALALLAWLPSETRHVRPMPRIRRGAFGHLFRNRRLVATYGVGFCVLFTQVAMFTYVTFHVAALPSFFWNAGGWPACVGLVVIVQAIGVAIALTQWSPAKGRYGEVIPEGV